METKIRFVIVDWATKMLASQIYFLSYDLALEELNTLEEGTYQIDKVFIRE